MVKIFLIKIGEYIGLIMNPVIMALIFYLLIFPVGMMSKFFGRDELKMKNFNAITFWIDVDKKINFNFFKKQG